MRESPALEIIEKLKKQKAKVSYYDPLVSFLKIGNIDLKREKLTSAKLKEFDCVLVATDHSSFDYRFIQKNANFIFDTRNVYKGKNFSNIERL